MGLMDSRPGRALRLRSTYPNRKESSNQVVPLDCLCQQLRQVPWGRLDSFSSSGAQGLVDAQCAGSSTRGRRQESSLSELL